MQVDLKVKSSLLTQALSSVQRQVPFAVSQTLNDVAFAARKEIVEKTYPKSFDIRNRQFPKTAFRVRKATKRKLEAALYDRTESDWLSRQVHGGIKKAPGGGRLAIPTKQVRRTARGRVTKSHMPSNLLSGKGFKVGTGLKQTIVKKVSGRQVAFFHLRDRARIRKRFPFYKSVQKVAQAKYQGAMRKRLAHAIKTAR